MNIQDTTPYLIAGLGMIMGHYIPWESWEPLNNKVWNRLFCYTWGPLWVIFALALQSEINNRLWVVTIFEVFILFATAGLATGLCYGVDWLREVKGRERRRAMSNER